MSHAVVHRFFEEAAVAFPERIAVRETERSIAYRALNEDANRLAFKLRELPGFTRGSMVAIGLPVGISYVTAMLGVLKASGVFVPLDPAWPQRRKQAFIERTTPAAGLTDGNNSDAWMGTAGISWLSVEAEGPAENPPVTVNGEDACYVMFTSGSTGEPKAILGRQKGLAHFIQWETREFGLDETIRVSQIAPSTFDVSLRDILVPLTTGGMLCVPPPETRARIDGFLDWLDAEGITLMHCVPSLFRALLGELERGAHASKRLARLDRILLAGEPLYGGDIRRWRTAMGERTELVNLYGPSETTLAKAFHRIREVPGEAGRMIPVGHPLPDTAILILRDGELCDAGEIGEVHIQTEFGSKGYLDDPARTAESFIPNPLHPGSPDVIYKTGDMGRYRPDGSVLLVGRKDGQVKVNGIRIELGEIEQALLQHPSIAQAAVAAHGGTDRETSLAAYFVAPQPLEDADLRKHLLSWLPESMHPSFFVQMNELPLNLHGKVVRRALPRPADLLYREQPCVPPSGEIEEALAEAWDEVLRVRRISVIHTFVELGGDSLKATQVLPRIAERLGIEIKLQDLFPRGTVRELAAWIAARRLGAP